MQKLTPLLLLITVSFLRKTITFLFLTSLFIRTVGGLKQSHFRPLIAYSSIHHII
ncbi:MAG: proton-conducting transporter membrane subunit [Bdellovibrionales bacterium]